MLIMLRYLYILSSILLLFSISSSTPIEYHLVISEIYPSTENPDSTFIELYNPLEYDIYLNNYSIMTHTSYLEETTFTIPQGEVIPSYGFYLVELSNTEENKNWPDYWPEPDLVFQSTLNQTSDGIILYDENEDIVDVVGWGNDIPPNFYEECPIDTPLTTESMERKSGYHHNESDGNAWDTDNNYEDFVYREEPEPQNTQSPKEDPSAQMENHSIGIIKALYGNNP